MKPIHPSIPKEINMNETTAPTEFPSNSQIAKEIIAITAVTVAVTAATLATVGAFSLAFSALDDKLAERRRVKALAKENCKKH
jgi:hypothetical protein